MIKKPPYIIIRETNTSWLMKTINGSHYSSRDSPYQRLVKIETSTNRKEIIHDFENERSRDNN